MRFEAIWYPLDAEWMYTKEAHFITSKYSDRVFFDKIKKKELIFIETLPVIESKIKSAKDELMVSSDPNISLSSSNPNQYLMSPLWNNWRRIALHDQIVEYTEKLSKIRHSLYRYVRDKHHELKYSDVVYDIFWRLKDNTIAQIRMIYPQLNEILSSISDNLNSEKATDWSNAVHNCRRAIYELSNNLYPANNKEIDIGTWKFVKLNDEKYILRLKEYIKSKSQSVNFQKITWSSLEYIGDRIDAIYKSSTKWWHEIIIDKKEAERYVIYTFILLGDILNL